MKHRTLPSLLLNSLVAGTLAVAAAFPAGDASAADKAASARLLPPNVLFYLNIPSVPDLKTDLKESDYGRLWRDESMAEFRKDVEAKYREAAEKFERDSGMKLKDVLELPTGEITLAVLTRAGKLPSFAGIVDYGDNEQTVDALLGKLRDAMDERGAERSTERIDDVQVVVYKFKKDEDDDSSKGPDQVAYFLRDSRFVVGSDLTSLEQILARWDGKHDTTFANSRAFEYLAEKTKAGSGKPALTWYLSPMDVVRAGMTAANNPQVQIAAAFFPALGITKLKAMGGSAQLNTENFGSVSKTMIYVDMPATGVLKIFQFPAVNMTPPKWVPADVAGWFAANWDVETAYEAVGDLVDMFQGDGAWEKLMDKVADEGNGPKIHPRKDVVDHLSGRMQVVTLPPEDADDPNPVPRFLFGLELKDVQKMGDVLSRIAKTDGFPGTERQFRGKTIYEMDAAGNKMAYGIAADHLFLSSDVKLLEQVVLGGRESLADSDVFRRFSRHIPEKTSMRGFQRSDTQVRSVYEQMRAGKTGDEVEGVDFTKLPPFEKIRKYLPATASFAQPDERGVMFQSFSLPAKSE